MERAADEGREGGLTGAGAGVAGAEEAGRRVEAVCDEATLGVVNPGVGVIAPAEVADDL